MSSRISSNLARTERSFRRRRLQVGSNSSSTARFDLDAGEIRRLTRRTYDVMNGSPRDGAAAQFLLVQLFVGDRNGGFGSPRDGRGFQ